MRGPRCLRYFKRDSEMYDKVVLQRERGSKLVKNSVTYFMDGPYVYRSIALHLSSLPSAVPTMRLSQDSSILPSCLFFLVALPVLVVFGYFPLQVLPDIVRPDSSCKSFLVSCQAVTNALLVG